MADITFSISDNKNNNVMEKRIRILKTGLANVQQHLNMDEMANRELFERIARPGTELKLVRVYDDPEDYFKIAVYYEGIYLGRVTKSKNQTVARLMDAGFEVIAIVNLSTPVHDTDTSIDAENADDWGAWTAEKRTEYDYNYVNLPYGIYLVDREM